MHTISKIFIPHWLVIIPFLSSICNNYMSYSWVWINASRVYMWYIGECMKSIININNGVNVPSTFGYRNCNTIQILIFDGYLEVRISVRPSYHLGWYWHSKPYSYMDDFTLDMNVLAYIDLDGIENKDIVKYSYPIDIWKREDSLIGDAWMVLKKMYHIRWTFQMNTCCCILSTTHVGSLKYALKHVGCSMFWI